MSSFERVNWFYKKHISTSKIKDETIWLLHNKWSKDSSSFLRNMQGGLSVTFIRKRSLFVPSIRCIKQYWKNYFDIPNKIPRALKTESQILSSKWKESFNFVTALTVLHGRFRSLFLTTLTIILINVPWIP